MTNNERKIINTISLLAIAGLLILNIYQYGINRILKNELKLNYYNEIIEPLLECANTIEKLSNKSEE